MTDTASKRVLKRSGLVGSGGAASAPGLGLSGKDVRSAASRLPQFDAPNVVALAPLAEATQGRAIVRLPLDALVESPYQPRLRYDEQSLAELAETLRFRQIEPILVRPLPDHRYEILSGHRRKRAAPLAQIAELDAVIVNVDDSQARVLVLAANEPREDFTDYERALAYQLVLNDGNEGGPVRSQRQLASHLGIDPALVVRRLSMLKLPTEVQEVLRQHPGAFSCRWVSKLLNITSQPYDKDHLRQALTRVAKGEIPISAVFSVMATAAHSSSSRIATPQKGLVLQRNRQLFAQITPNDSKRHVMVKLPGECDIGEVAQLILNALASRYEVK